MDGYLSLKTLLFAILKINTELNITAVVNRLTTVAWDSSTRDVSFCKTYRNKKG